MFLNSCLILVQVHARTITNIAYRASVFTKLTPSFLHFFKLSQEKLKIPSYVFVKFLMICSWHKYIDLIDIFYMLCFPRIYMLYCLYWVNLVMHMIRIINLNIWNPRFWEPRNFIIFLFVVMLMIVRSTRSSYKIIYKK